jgi:tetratricopeptide (TPR) repeat protein
MWKRLFGPTSIEDYGAKALKALASGDAARAIKLAGEAVERFPASFDARLLHSTVLSHSGDTEGAVATLDAVADQHPARSWMQKAVVFENASDRTRALDAYGRAAEVTPTLADAWLAWGTALADDGQHAVALEKFERAMALDPREPVAPFNRGNSLSRLHRLDDALASYEKAHNLGSESARSCVRSTLLKLGRIDDANALRASQADPQGDAREQRLRLGEVTLVARYFVGQHSNPELLDSKVRQMLESVAAFKDKPPGLEEGVIVRYAWTHLTVWAQGSLRVLCEPDWDVEPRTNHKELVTFSAMHLVMTQVVQDLTGATPTACSCHDTIFIEEGAIDAGRSIMFRREPGSDGDSGWVLRCTLDEEFVGARIPMTALVSAAPHLLKVVHLPVRWTAHFEDNTTLVQVYDADQKPRLPKE